jgi:hypothetical protein
VPLHTDYDWLAAGRARIPSVISVVLRPFSVRIKKCDDSRDRTACADPPSRCTPWSPTHGRCVDDLFLIRTEEERTTVNTESGMFLAASLTEQVIGLAIEVHRNTGPGRLAASPRHVR